MAKKLTPLGGAAAFGLSAVVLTSIWLTSPEPEEESGNALLEDELVTVEEQSSKSAYTKIDGRSYKLWSGYVIENPNNDELEHAEVNLDELIYDFDLEIITVDSISKPGENGEFEAITFSELRKPDGTLPPHIDRVKQVGCKLSQEFIDRANTEEYGPAPDHVQNYHTRHCILNKTP